MADLKERFLVGNNPRKYELKVGLVNCKQGEIPQMLTTIGWRKFGMNCNVPCNYPHLMPPLLSSNKEKISKCISFLWPPVIPPMVLYGQISYKRSLSLRSRLSLLGYAKKNSTGTSPMLQRKKEQAAVWFLSSPKLLQIWQPHVPLMLTAISKGMRWLVSTNCMVFPSSGTKELKTVVFLGNQQNRGVQPGLG